MRFGLEICGQKLCLAHIKSNLKFSQIIWLNFEKLTYRTFQNVVFQKYINSLSELHAHVKAARERCGGHACREQADGQHHQQHQVEQRQRQLQQSNKFQNNKTYYLDYVELYTFGININHKRKKSIH